MEEQIGRVRIPRKGEVLGIVESMLGASRLRVRCQDGVLRICRIPGKMRKRIWMRIGDTVLVEPWEIQKGSGDVIWKYTATEAGWLRRKNIFKMSF
jgi:translation initiation factor 1A